MASSKGETSRCGLCRFYSHEGRRGGFCSQLNAPVSSEWKACCLAVSPFQEASEDGLGIAEWSPTLPTKFVAKAAVLPVKAKVASMA